ncbi:hypothetical protein BIW11_09304 [Tropilaelaps mercedesae]|uniref:RING-type domain-containing protein n=1 Tax=Tropilaelaps mercedesae TaxID=418985 RepID=A0A1V9XKP1_9ACAR|nr:hypothetical protein BIW11_09304 [Tropilaelaps mercedesae]
MPGGPKSAMATSRIRRGTANIRMHLVDLPSEICPGGVELRPLDATSASRLKACCICQGHSANAYSATCGHSFCSHCATVRPSEYGTETASSKITQVWCHCCKARKDAEQVQVTAALETMRFACPCGFEGKLREIKQHFWKSPEVGGHREDDEVEEGHQTEHHSHITQRLQEQHEKFTAELQELRHHIETRLEAHRSGKQFISIHVRDLIEQHLEKKTEVWSNLYRWWGDGYPCATQIHIDVVKNVSWLGVYHQTFFEASTQPWPMKKRIRFELLNAKGAVAKTYEAPVYVNGKSISKCFAAPLKDGGYGLSKVIKVDKLLPTGNIITEDGILALTVEAISLSRPPSPARIC